MSESLNLAGLYAATLLALGACTAIWLVPLALATAADRVDSVAMIRRSADGAVIATLALWTLLLLRLVTHASAVFGFRSALTGDSLRIIALDSRWGGGWRLQTIVASACVAGALWHRAARTFPSRVVLTVAVATWAFALPLSGHSATSAGHLAVAAAHALGAGAWIGTLAILAVVTGASAPRAPHQPSARAALFQRFSAVALTGVGTVVATGLVMVWLYLDSPREIVHSGYGRLLAVKLSLFAAISAAGFLNWRRARLGEPVPFASWEVALAALLLLVTGFLTQSPPP